MNVQSELQASGVICLGKSSKSNTEPQQSAQMVRQDQDIQHDSQPYGHDHVTGYFFNVSDERLVVSKETGDDFDTVRYKVSPDGGGTYFSVQTAKMGLGTRVSYQTMEKLWRLYEVGDAGLKLLAEKRSVPGE